MSLGFSAYALSLLAGVLTTLSPCVLPLLPILFAAALTTHRMGPIALAAGVALSFAVLGVLLAAGVFVLWAGGVAAVLLGVFASVALLLAAVGIYGVMSYLVVQRTHEIGIRMALGAERRDVLRLVIRMGVGLVGGGIFLGIIASLAVARVIATQLWGVSAYDPITLTSVAALLLITGIVACWVPARRASRVDPLIALRYE